MAKRDCNLEENFSKKLFLNNEVFRQRLGWVFLDYIGFKLSSRVSNLNVNGSPVIEVGESVYPITNNFPTWAGINFEVRLEKKNKYWKEEQILKRKQIWQMFLWNISEWENRGGDGRSADGSQEGAPLLLRMFCHNRQHRCFMKHQFLFRYFLRIKIVGNYFWNIMIW